MGDAKIAERLQWLGAQIAREHLPHQRRNQWLGWSRQVKQAIREHPTLATLGLSLTYETFPEDLRILGSYQSAGGTDARSVTEHPTSVPPSTVINVFISHKSEDAHVAIALKRLLELYAAGRLVFHISEEIPKGSEWFRWIKTKLMESRMLLLLFTDITASWDWCLYEAGLFTQWDSDWRRVICLHTAETPPPPLNHLQSVPAKRTEVERFLRQLFVDTTLTGLDRPVNVLFSENPEELTRIADEIAKLMRRETVRTEHLTKFLQLEISQPDLLESGGIPPNTQVKSNAESLEIFSKKPGNWTWPQLEIGGDANPDVRWVMQLRQAMSQAIRGNLVDPIQATFRSRRDGRQYRPLLHSMDIKADGRRIFTILFTEDASWQFVGMSAEMRSLLIALVMTVRFRHEVLDRYRGDLRERFGVKRDAAVCEEIRHAIVSIELEAASHGLTQRDVLIDAFEAKSDRDELNAMYDDWEGLRRDLFAALEGTQLARVQELLGTLRSSNQRFLELATRRHHEMVQQPS